MTAPVIMPENPTEEAIKAMRRAVVETPIRNDGTSDIHANIYRALYAELSKPPEPETKEVEVWRVEYTWHRDPRVIQCLTKESAEVTADMVRSGSDNHCITVTGPHKQRVPA